MIASVTSYSECTGSRRYQHTSGERTAAAEDCRERELRSRASDDSLTNLASNMWKASRWYLKIRFASEPESSDPSVKVAIFHDGVETFAASQPRS